MANKVVIEVEVQGGKATAALNGIRVDLQKFEESGVSAFNAGRSSASGFIDAVGAAQLAVAALAVGVVAYGKASVDASREAANAQRFILNSSISAKAGIDQQIESAERLRKELGLARSEAQQVQGGALNAANFVGRPQDADRFAKALADLRAAKGVATDLVTLQKQLFTSDEATDKLLNRNPSQVAKEYIQANQLKGVDPQDIQNLSIFLRVLDEGAKVSGAASAAINDLGGEVSLVVNRWEDLKSVVGNFILENSLVNDSLRATVALLGSFTDAANKFQVRSPLEAAAEDAQSFGAQFEQYVTDPIQKGANILITDLKSLGLAFRGTFTLDKFGDFDKFYALQSALREELKRIDNDRSLNAQERQAARNNTILAAEVKQGRWVNGVRLSDQEFAEYGKSFQDDQQRKQAADATARTAAARERQAGEASAKQAADAEKKAAREREQAFKSALGFIDEISARSTGNQNPFIKLFTEGETAAARMQERFGALGDKVVGEFTAMERQAVAFETSTLRLRRNLRAVELEFSAEQVKKAYVGVTAEQERQLGILQRRLTAAANAPGLRREAEAFERGFVTQNAFEARREQFENFERIKGLRPQGGDEGARAGQKLIDDYVLEQTKNLNIGARNSPDPATRSLAEDRARALRAQADRFEAEIEDERKRAEAGRSQINLAGVKLQELARLAPGTDASAVRKEFLAITEKLDPKELSAALRDGLSAALREEAQHERQLEQEARDFQQQLVGPGGILHQIKLAIESNDPAKQSAPQLPPPTPAETARGIAEFERRRFNPQQQAADDDEVVRKNDKPAYDSKAAYEEARRRIEVNPFSQDFFRARPGFDPKNDPRTFNADDPYGREFLRAGYFDNYQARRPEEAAADQPEVTKATEQIVNVLNQIAATLRKGSTVNVTVSDGLELDRVLGAQPRPEEFQR